MVRRYLYAAVVAVLIFKALMSLTRSPGALSQSISHPLRTIAGTGHQLNARLLEASESPDSIREAGRRLLQPWGVVRVTQIYNTPEAEVKKIDKAQPR